MKTQHLVSIYLVAAAIGTCGCSSMRESSAENAEAGETKVRLDQTPAPVRHTIERELVGAQLEDIALKQRQGQNIYETDIIRFANTIGTNTIIQRDGSKVGLILTAGREHLAPVHTGDGKVPLIQPDMIFGLEEEVSPHGELIKVPEEQAALSCAQELIERGARCLVIALANSEFNPGCTSS